MPDDDVVRPTLDPGPRRAAGEEPRLGMAYFDPSPQFGAAREAWRTQQAQHDPGRLPLGADPREDTMVPIFGSMLYPHRRADGWPLCPGCGEDELYSLAEVPSERTIVGCYRCSWKPPSCVQPIPTVHPAHPDHPLHRKP